MLISALTLVFFIEKKKWHVNTSKGVEYLQLKSTALVHDIAELNLEGKVENRTFLSVFLFQLRPGEELGSEHPHDIRDYGCIY